VYFLKNQRQRRAAKAALLRHSRHCKKRIEEQSSLTLDCFSLAQFENDLLVASRISIKRLS
jgi:hypothetical protein